MYGIHSGEPVSDCVFFAWYVFDLENIALEEDTPVNIEDLLPPRGLLRRGVSENSSRVGER